MIEAKHLMTAAGHSQPHLEAALQAHVSGSVVPWEKHTDPGSGNNFYFNRETNESAWDPPDDFVGAHEGKSDKELSKDEFVDFIKSTKEEDTSIAAEIDYIYEQIWYLKELRAEHLRTKTAADAALATSTAQVAVLRAQLERVGAQMADEREQLAARGAEMTQILMQERKERKAQKLEMVGRAEFLARAQSRSDAEALDHKKQVDHLCAKIVCLDERLRTYGS